MKTLLTVLLLASAVTACSGLRGKPDRPEAFAERLVEAVRSGSAERRRALILPRSLECARAHPGLYLEDMVSRQLAYALPASPRVEVAPLEPEAARRLVAELDYPVAPTSQVEIHFDTGPNASAVLGAFVAYEAGRWYEVLPCPSPALAARMAAAKEARAGQEQRAAVLAERLDDATRAEIVRLVRGGRGIDAIRLCAERSGEDLWVAKRAVELVKLEPR